MSYIDALKCKEFLSDMVGHVKKAEVVNFNMIYNRISGDPLQEYVKTYQPIKKKILLVIVKSKGKTFFLLLYILTANMSLSKKKL